MLTDEWIFFQYLGDSVFHRQKLLTFVFVGWKQGSDLRAPDDGRDKAEDYEEDDVVYAAQAPSSETAALCCRILLADGELTLLLHYRQEN